MKKLYKMALASAGRIRTTAWSRTPISRGSGITSNEQVVLHDSGGGRGRSFDRLRRGTAGAPSATAGAQQTHNVAQHLCGLKRRRGWVPFVQGSGTGLRLEEHLDKVESDN